MVQDLVNKAKPKMEATLAHYAEELKTVRTGRASAGMLDNVMVPYYGSQTPLKAVATVSVPDATTIMIQPFDTGALNDIRLGIQQADLGFNPSDDGRVMRVTIPPLTADRREDLVKLVGKMSESARVSIRATRGEIWEEVQAAEKAKTISEDNRDWGRAELDKLAADYNKKIETLTKEKEVEIRTV